MAKRPAALELLADWSRVVRGHRWFLFGAQAVNIYGRPRLTADVDVTLEWPRSDLLGLLKKARAHGFELLVSDVEKFLSATSVLPFVHRATGMPLDVVVAGSGLEREQLKNARLIRLGAIRIPVIAPEDLVITKLLAGRPKDVEDATSVFREQREAIDIRRVTVVLSQIEEAVDVSDLVRSFDRIVAEARHRRARSIREKPASAKRSRTKASRTTKKRK